MSDHADTIRRLEAADRAARSTADFYERKLAEVRAERQQLREALQRLKGNVWRWEVPDDVREQVDAALAGEDTP